MISRRIAQPDTEADVAIRRCLDEKPPSSFVVVAGAGSGKTTSLIKALDHLAKSRGDILRRNNQKIACITYTDVAVGEISSDVGNAPIFHVSTIHSFLWTLISPFQHDLREWIDDRINEKIADAEEKIAKPRTHAKTREKLASDIAKWRTQSGALASAKSITYSTGSDYGRGKLGHADILKAGPYLLLNRPLLGQILAKRFPVTFVDESQDTSPDFVKALRHVSGQVGSALCLGFFGDPMQKIYTTGAGPIQRLEGWGEITKPENFRCPITVLELINRIRAEDDGLRQTRGRTVTLNGVASPVQGNVNLFILPADEHRTLRISQVRDWLARKTEDLLWTSDNQDADVRVLVLVHRMAATRLGFPNLYAALNDHAPDEFKAGVVDGTAWPLRPFLTYLIPLAKARRENEDFSVVRMLRIKSPVLSNEQLIDANVSAVLAQLSQAVDEINEAFHGNGTNSILDVLRLAHSSGLLGIDERFVSALGDQSQTPPDDDKESSDALQRYLACDVKEILNYRKYVEGMSPFATQQGVKGAEFERVLVLLDDEEGAYSLFSYGKYFGYEPLSDADEENLAADKDSVLGRTRRLFYVCCSRSTHQLAIVLFAPDVAAARAAIVQKDLFSADQIKILADI